MLTKFLILLRDSAFALLEKIFSSYRCIYMFISLWVLILVTIAFQNYNIFRTQPDQSGKTKICFFIDAAAPEDTWQKSLTLKPQLRFSYNFK